MASHMLRNGGNLRVVQDLLEHERLHTIMRYTWLDANHIKGVHEQFHPHEEGANAEIIPAEIAPLNRSEQAAELKRTIARAVQKQLNEALSGRDAILQPFLGSKHMLRDHPK
jgi:hypothetical protein